MPFENNNSNEQIKIDTSKQKEQIDRDFDDILKEYSEMSHEEQWEFIEAIANKDPHFKELYTELKAFFQDRVMNPENYDNHLKLEAVKKHIEGTELDNSKNEKITLEPNIDNLATLKAKFYRTWPDNELHSKYFTIANWENQKLATIKSEFDNWIIRAREYIDNKYQANDKSKSEVVRSQENTVKTDTNLENNTIQENNQITEQIEPETIKTNDLIETQKSFFETNKDFASFSDFMSEKTINWSPVIVLDDNIYDALLRYEDNPEPLIKALAYKELNKANSELEASKKAIATSMQYKPENMDRAYQYSYEQFETKKDKILEDFKGVAEKFNQLIKTDAWKLLVSNTAFTSFESKLKTDINTQLWYDENTENQTNLNIENNTKELLLNLWVIENKFNDKIKDFLANQNHLKANDYITWEKILYTDFPNQLENSINEEIKLYSKNIWENLIKSNAWIVKQWWTFNLPIWNWENVRLDFSELWDISNLDNKQILELYNSNFDSIYRNDLKEKIADSISDIWDSMKENPWKTAIDISSIIFAWIWAVLASEWSWVITAPLIAWPTFTVLDNWYRAWMYEAFDIEWWWEAWLWIEESDTHNDILRKKLFELTWNTALFWMFKATWLLEKKYLPQIDSQLKSMAIKTPVEAWFFTYYSVVSENLQNTVKNDWNTAELLNDFSEIPNFNVLMKSYIYNLWFITAVKAWAIPAEKMVIAWYQKQLNKELWVLKEKWYIIVNTWEWYAFFKWNTKLEWNDLRGFEKFIDLNKKVNYIAMEQYRKPESWRWWKSAYSTTFREQKFQNLEKYSKEAQSWKIDYALNDWIIWKNLTDNWIWNKWENVWKWLLEKSWFEKWEKVEPKTKFERDAVKEMEKANEVIYKDLILKTNLYIKWMMEWKTITEIFPNYKTNELKKLQLIIKKNL